MRLVLAVMALSVLGYCKDETVTGYGGAEAVWHLESLDGAAFPARATLMFPAEGELAGEGPCNRYSGRQTVPYPWFAAQDVTATKRACPELAEEALYLTALAEMTLVEVLGDVMILSNDAGREMVFRAGE
ncbi:MAG: META domain-containing protein [Roseovarius sp.]|uniref:META domain-containing protein n=1 Tax=Roseovarius sp. TaxID=1486281 RepID=UPI001B4B369E|nr:META domain-containing protein [Roseovarius sp.]MBQ0749546.1 META domain-containing protein [Roseovarius sp.]MBQ0810698.1 META domain-containing protein [Roseovarius sp.]